MIRLFVGLGNPGQEYKGTRHNAGFAYIDELAQQLNIKLAMDRGYFGYVGRATLSGGNIWLLQPQTYMNLSGKSVAALAKFFKIQPHEILVAHDELDLDPGQIKIKQGGGHAGHNGLRDIHQQLGCTDYWRLRLGIGHPGEKYEVAAYVLRQPSVNERTLIEKSMSKALMATDALLGGNMNLAVQLIHAGEQRPKPPRMLTADKIQKSPTDSKPDKKIE